MTPEIEPTNRRKERPAMTDHLTPGKSRLSDEMDRLPDAQRERASHVVEAIRANHAAPSLKLAMKDGTLEIGFERESAEVATLLQMADIGTTDRDFYTGLLSQISCLGSQKRSIDSASSNFVLAVVRSVNPRDSLEAMLATQMGAIHAATMMLARRLNHVETIPQQDAAERAFNKLARTFATQMEALKRYRTSGQQKVTVEHVTVNAGGQAIVGTVATGGGGRK
jgi:hypothetical protein